MTLPNIKDMMAQIEQDIALTAARTGVRNLSNQVHQAMAETPRHLFMHENDATNAYKNSPFPIGFHQTISQPFIVALMTELLDIQKDNRVLEIGTGSGYQSAILSLLASEVYTLETISPLAIMAKERFKNLGLTNVHAFTGDGHGGLPKYAPYDRIIVTAATPKIPLPLFEELREGGIMVAPLEDPLGNQVLKTFEKDKGGMISSRKILAVRFVPLVDSHEKKV